mgnify:CR=1 FL=1
MGPRCLGVFDWNMCPCRAFILQEMKNSICKWVFLRALAAIPICIRWAAFAMRILREEHCLQQQNYVCDEHHFQRYSLWRASLQKVNFSEGHCGNWKGASCNVFCCLLDLWGCCSSQNQSNPSHPVLCPMTAALGTKTCCSNLFWKRARYTNVVLAKNVSIAGVLCLMGL